MQKSLPIPIVTRVGFTQKSGEFFNGPDVQSTNVRFRGYRAACKKNTITQCTRNISILDRFFIVEVLAEELDTPKYDLLETTTAAAYLGVFSGLAVVWILLVPVVGKVIGVMVSGELDETQVTPQTRRDLEHRMFRLHARMLTFRVVGKDKVFVMLVDAITATEGRLEMTKSLEKRDKINLPCRFSMIKN
jgi:hypothetical protein